MMGNEGGSPKRTELVQSALRLYVRKTELELAESRSWIRQPNNFISVVAIVLSLLGIAYQFMRDREEDVERNLASLSAIVEDLTKLDSDVLTASAGNAQIAANLSIAVTNRRVSLLTEADRIIKELGTRAPRAQLAVLAPEYLQIDDYQTALKYMELLTRPSAPPMEQISAWRSIALMYSNEGPAELNDARHAFAKAASISPDPKDLGSINLDLGVYEQWAQVEYIYHSVLSASRYITKARILLNSIPCFPARASSAARIDAEGQSMLNALRDADPPRFESAQRAWTAAVAADVCGNVPVAQEKLKGTALTTICRFSSGPRAGTAFDFAPLGIKGVAVGSSCTDGQGSFGVAVR